MVASVADWSEYSAVVGNVCSAVDMRSYAHTCMQTGYRCLKEPEETSGFGRLAFLSSISGRDAQQELFGIQRRPSFSSAIVLVLSSHCSGVERHNLDASCVTRRRCHMREVKAFFGQS